MTKNKKTTEYRRTIMRRALAILLCLSLVVGYMPAIAATAYATDGAEPVVEEHTHDHEADLTDDQTAGDTESTEATEDVTDEINEELTEALNEAVEEQLEEVVEEDVTETEEQQDPAQVPAAASLDAADEPAAQAEEMVFYVYDSKGEVEEFFGDLKEALAFAGRQNGEMTVMLLYGNTYMVKGENGDRITVPSNVTLFIDEDAQLLLPFKYKHGTDAEYESTTASDNGESETRVAWAKEDQYLNQTLVVEGDIYIEEGGKLTVAGLTGTTEMSAPQGQTSGSYSQVILNSADADITVEGDLEVFGLVKGGGDIMLNHGGTLHVPFYIADFGGGTNILYGSKTLFPTQQFGMNSVQSHVVLNYGADIAGVAKIHAALEGIEMFASTGMVVIGHGDGIIDMQPGSRVDINYVENRLQPDCGALEVTAQGNATIGSIQSEIMGIKITSIKKYISIPYNWHLYLNDGEYSVPDEMYVKLMPGSEFVLGDGAILNLEKGSKFLAYDGFIQSIFGSVAYPSPEKLQSLGYSAAGQFILDGGQLNVKDGATFAGTLQNRGGGKVTTSTGAALSVGYDSEYIDGFDGTKDGAQANTITSLKLAAKYWDGSQMVDVVPGETITAYPNAVTDPEDPKYGLYNWSMDKFQINYWMEPGKKNEIPGGYYNYPEAESRTGAWNIVDVALLTEENLEGYSVEMTTDNEALLEKGAIGIDGTVTVTVKVEDGYTINDKAPADDNYPEIIVKGASAGVPVHTEADGVHTFVYTVNNITGNVTVDVTGVEDKAAPTGKVSVTVTNKGQELTWVNQLIFKIADLLNVNVKEKITITADDKGSGIDTVHYYVSDPASANHPTDLDALKKLPADSWKDASGKTDDWAEGVTFTFDEAAWIQNLTDTTDASDLIVYVKITDKAGNVSYISSGGMRYDNRGPVVTFGGSVVDADTAPVYHEDKAVTVAVTDANLVADSVKYKIGKNGAWKSEGASFTVKPLDENIPYIVTAEDIAGNTVEVTFYYLKPLTVKFESFDGTSQYFSQQHYGDTITVPAGKEPAAGNVKQQFAGWEAADGTIIEAGSELTVNGNASYKATYSKLYKVTAPAETAAYGVSAVTEGSYFEPGAQYTFQLTNKNAEKYCNFAVTAKDAAGQDVAVAKDADYTYTITVGTQAVIFNVTPVQHELSEKITKQPTCNEFGTSETTCANCDYKVVNNEVPKLSHNFDSIDEEQSYPATCTTEGKTVGQCSVCGDKTAAEIIPATGHNYSVVKSEKDSTCAAAGEIVKVCSNVNAVIEDGKEVTDADGTVVTEACTAEETFFIAKKDHELTTVTVESDDCTVPDYEVTTCANCDYEKSVAVEGTTKAHKEVTVIEAVAAGCETAGNTIGTECEDCGKVLLESAAIAPLGHKFSGEFTETEPATCDKDGLAVDACQNNCGEAKTKVLPKLGHEYEVTTQQQTCTQDGFTKKYCDVCKSTVITDQKDAAGHTEVEIPAVAATCYADGAEAGVKCSTCGEILTAPKVIKATGEHSWSADPIEAKPATCTEDGYFILSCTNHSKCTATQINVITAGGHKWADPVVKVPAECGQIGVKVTVCNTCGEQIFETVKAKDHNIVNDLAVDPTCDETGLTAGSHCGSCGLVLVKQTVVKALGHKIVAAGEAKDATCEGTGLTAGAKCSTCGTLLDAQKEIPALGHKMGKWTVTKEATCTADGEKESICKTCGHKETETIKTDGHKYGEPVVTAPTCTVDGYTTETCAVCGDVQKYDIVAAEHDWAEVKVVKEATCTEEGLQVGKCNKCGADDETVKSVIPALTHSYKSVTVAATCTEDGYTSYTCERCGDTYKEDGAAAAHTVAEDKGYGATCTEPGLTDGSHCSVCGEVLEAQTVIPADGHSYGKVVTAPACTANGYTTYTCNVCGDSYKDDTVLAAGHKFGEWTVDEAASCEAAGEESRSCACGEVETRTVDALGHTAEAVAATPATCEKDGLTAGSKCAVCGEVLKAQETVKALGHEYKDAVTAPTCTEKGYTTHSCTRCDSVYTDGETAATGHSWKDAGVVKAATCQAAGIAKEECTGCGETQEVEIAKLAHTPKAVAAAPATCVKTGLTEGSVCSVCDEVLKAQEVVAKADHVCDSFDGKEATCTAKGYEPYDVCRICDYTTYKEIPAKGHSYKDEVIAATCTEAGQIVKLCKCGDAVIEAGEEAKGHTPVIDAAVAAGCESSGKTEGSHCSECGEILKVQAFVAAKGHAYGNKVYQMPTATADGGWYHVCDGCGKTEWTETQTYAQYIEAGVAALVVKAAAEADQQTETVKLSWTKSSEFAVDGYEIWRSTSADGTFTKVGTVEVKADGSGDAAQTYTDKTAKAGTKYYYKVAGVRTVGEASYKTPFSAAVSAQIKKVTASEVKATKMYARTSYAAKGIAVRWSSPNIKVDGYEIWRSNKMNGTYKLIKTTKGEARQWTNSGLKTQTRWFYKVRGYKLVNGKKVYTKFSAKGYRYVLNGTNAKLANAIEKSDAVTAKKAVKVQKGIKVTWSKDSDIKCNRYEIWRSTSKNGTYTKIATTKNLSYTDKAKTLKKGKRYYYKVVGYRFFGKACPRTNASNVVSAVR